MVHSKLRGKTLPPLVVMGVSGSGKSTIGALLGEALGVSYVEGDRLDSAAGTGTMESPEPPDDAEREPWLRRIGDLLKENYDDGTSVVVACSVLKHNYRQILGGYVPRTVYIHLDGSRAVIDSRLSQREHQYMPPGLLDSQFEALEALRDDESAITVDIDQSTGDILRDIEEQLVTLMDTSTGPPDEH